MEKRGEKNAFAFDLKRKCVLPETSKRFIGNASAFFQAVQILVQGTSGTSAATGAAASAGLSFPPDDLTEETSSAPKHAAGYDDIYEKVLHTHKG